MGVVLDVLRAHRYHFSGEHQLQEGLALALTEAGLPVRREVRLTARDRVDLLTGRVGIEVKVAGSAETVLRQVQRYATSDLLDALIVVTTRATHRALPDVVGGKPLAVIYVGGVV